MRKISAVYRGQHTVGGMFPNRCFCHFVLGQMIHTERGPFTNVVETLTFIGMGLFTDRDPVKAAFPVERT